MKFKIKSKVKFISQQRQDNFFYGYGRPIGKTLRFPEIGTIIECEDNYREYYVKFKTKTFWIREGDLVAAELESPRGHGLTRMFAPDKPVDKPISKDSPGGQTLEKKPTKPRASKKNSENKTEILNKNLDIPVTF